MRVDDPAVLDFVRRCMVARIATVSRNGRPSVTSLYFICRNGLIWLGTAEWTLAAREARADPRVTLLLNVERDPRDRRILRITGRATVRTDPEAQRINVRQSALKYTLNPGGLWNILTHIRQFRLMDRYHKQSAAKGLPCIIEVTPEHAEFLTDTRRG